MEEVFAELHNAYCNSAEGQTGVMICIVAIRYANEIINAQISIKQLLEMADVPYTYRTDITRGLNLSKYVDLKPEFR